MIECIEVVVSIIIIIMVFFFQPDPRMTEASVFVPPDIVADVTPQEGHHATGQQVLHAEILKYSSDNHWIFHDLCIEKQLLRYFLIIVILF